jgi:hypothetical protein
VLISVVGIGASRLNDLRSKQEVAVADQKRVEAETQLSQQLQTIQDATNESKRLQVLNTDLQRQLLDSSATIAKLSEDTLVQVKGSPDSVVELSPNFTDSAGGDYENGVAAFDFYNTSKYPMIDAYVYVSATRYLEAERLQWKIGDVYPERGGKIPKFSVTLRKDVDSEIEFGIRSRSGMLWQRIVFSWNGKGWVIDDSMFKEVGGKEVYIKKIRDDFPYKNRKSADVAATE